MLGAAGCVLLFFLTFVLPQFASVLQDFGAKVDPFILGFLNFSTFLRANADAVLAILAALIAGGWLLLRQDERSPRLHERGWRGCRRSAR